LPDFQTVDELVDFIVADEAGRSSVDEVVPEVGAEVETGYGKDYHYFLIYFLNEIIYI